MSPARLVRIRLPLSERPPPRHRTVLLSTTIVLVMIGVIMVQSSTSVQSIAAGQGVLTGLNRQGLFAVLGVLVMLAISRLRVSTIKKFAWWALLAGLLLQLLVYTPLGYEAGGNRNWIRIGPFTGQPAELMKVILVVWIGTVLSAKQGLLGSWKHVIVPVVPVVGLSILINILGGDLGTITILAAVLFGALYFSGIGAKVLFALAVVSSLAMVAMTLIKPNRVLRVLHYLETDCRTDLSSFHGLCWQPMQGLWALASGGIWGVGVGNSKAKWSWLPAADNDYIFAVIGEELGLIGAVAVLGLFLLLLGSYAKALKSTRDPFSLAVIGGTLTWIMAQMVVNISVVLGFLPTLGVPLPFISSGGTSLVAVLAATGVVLACAREATPTQTSGHDKADRIKVG